MRIKKSFLTASILIFQILLISNTFATSLKPAHIYADSLMKQSITFSLPWKYHSGDNLDWAKAEYEDSDWDSMRTLMPITKSIFKSFQGIGWFRRTVIIDSALMNRPVAFYMWHYGASQIYLNGKLVHEFGKVANNLSDEKIYQPRNIPISLTFDNDSVNVIAVRYSNFHATTDREWFKKWFNHAGFRVRISEINRSILSSVHNEGMTLSINIGISSIFLALAFLYFVLFFFYSMKKENLYYSFFTLFISLTFLLQMVIRFNHTSLEFFAVIDLIKLIVTIFIFPSYLAFLYSIFYKNFPKQFIAFILVAAIMAFMAYYLSGNYDSLIKYILFGFMFITTIEGLRIIIIAIKKKKTNAWVIGAGNIVFASFIITMFVIGLMKNANINSVWGILLFFSGLISLPISMSVYLARDIAQTNTKLKVQLETVKALSKKQIQQERKNAELKLQAELAESENKRKSIELEEARELQLSMLPKKLPELPNLDIAVYMKTATEVGGDYYDFHVGLDGTLTVVVGDATGHGMKAGTLVTTTKSLFDILAPNPDILVTYSEMSRVIKEMNFHQLTMCLMMLKIKNDKLLLSTAAMPPLLVYRKQKNEIEEIFIKGMPLGAMKNYPYTMDETLLGKGDTLFIYSDGLPELQNNSGKMYGYEKIKSEFLSVVQQDPKAIINHFKNSASQWANGKPPNDDATFVVIQVKT